MVGEISVKVFVKSPTIIENKTTEIARWVLWDYRGVVFKKCRERSATGGPNIQTKISQSAGK